MIKSREGRNDGDSDGGAGGGGGGFNHIPKYMNIYIYI